ncbi:GTP-binding protein HflX [Desulfurobacterium pacificum]|uniref:GTPase HflX n=1 Tax=Desulfurobacterium pacificum TaxID=240166 RepID=A0ABY1NNR8_9BACT|nr:GTPase HflX [Desulfurobacterium pacificum]SMP13422.1 GTP-binding protein HflX [Desulfurobacterium pacificum]
MEKERVAIVAVQRKGEEIDTEELKGLIEALGGEVIQTVIQKRRSFSPSTYIGKGKLEEVDKNATLIVAYHPLTYSQKRNIEEITGIPVMDRTEVILEIFARRAKTKEAKLQVELAKSYYKLSHIRGMGKAMSRLGGGVGTRGPGETQTEKEARALRRKIHKLRQEINNLIRRQELVREGRKRKGFKTVSIVGYTNAGKSTLLRSLTRKDVFIKDMPFATLDVKTGSLFLDGEKVLISDTVGFIKNLPHELVASFHATLSEVKEADLLLIVFDVSSEKIEEELKSVKAVLKKLNSWDKPKIFVANKIDKVKNFDIEALREKTAGIIPEDSPLVCISALKKEGLDELKEKIKEMLSLSGEK